MSKIIAHQKRLDGGKQGSEERAQFTDYMAHDYPSSKQREIGCEVRKKGPSKTTPKHSLNLCNGYAAGNWANLPCKESPFCTQHFKERERSRVRGSQWARGRGGTRLADAHLSPGVTEIGGGCFENEEIRPIWGNARRFSQHRGDFHLQKKKKKKHHCGAIREERNGEGSDGAGRRLRGGEIAVDQLALPL